MAAMAVQPPRDRPTVRQLVDESNNRATHPRGVRGICSNPCLSPKVTKLRVSLFSVLGATNTSATTMKIAVFMSFSLLPSFVLANSAYAFSNLPLIVQMQGPLPNPLSDVETV
jgi:hypothetical protein